MRQAGLDEAAERTEKGVDEIEGRCEMKDRQPCIHGNLCRGIYKLTGCIYSVRCPYGCKFYEPVKIVKKGR